MQVSVIRGEGVNHDCKSQQTYTSICWYLRKKLIPRKGQVAKGCHDIQREEWRSEVTGSGRRVGWRVEQGDKWWRGRRGSRGGEKDWREEVVHVQVNTLIFSKSIQNSTLTNCFVWVKWFGLFFLMEPDKMMNRLASVMMAYDATTYKCRCWIRGGWAHENEHRCWELSCVSTNP
jgi:hypothetical protein